MGRGSWAQGEQKELWEELAAAWDTGGREEWERVGITSGGGGGR